MQDDAIRNLNKIRPQRDVDSGRTAMEADAFEQALEESKLQSHGSWLDLFSKTYLKRTVVSCLLFKHHSIANDDEIVTFMFFFQQVTGQQFANSYGPS